MSKLALTFWCAIILAVGVVDGVKLFAADPAPAPSTQPAATAKPINTKCIVSGEDIDPSITVVYNGVTYGFCCQDCVKAFNKNPEKYVSAAK
jgi:YHS domain-containing protein